MKEKQSFVNMALIYSAALIIVKFIGAFYKIFLGNVLTTVASSYYSFAYPYFNAMLAITTVGIPAAIAKITSEYLAEDNALGAELLFVVMRRIMIVVGIISTALLFFAAPFITTKGGNAGAQYSMQAISLALIVVAFMAVYRGYFQGHSNLVPFGLSQIADQIGRVILGIVLASALLQYGDQYAAAGASFAATLGTFFGLITLLYFKWRNDKKTKLKVAGKVKISDHSEEIKRIVKIAIPIVIGASVIPLVEMIDTQIVINRLMAMGYASDAAKENYSYYAFYTTSMINFPQVIFTALQASLLPVVSFLIASKDYKGVGNTIRTALKLSLIVGIPAALGLFALAEPIIMLLYPSKPDVIAAVPSILKIAAFALIPLSLFQATTGILQGMEKQVLPARNLLIGAVFKIFICYALVGIPSINVKGAPISTMITFFMAALLNLLSLSKYSQAQYNIIELIIKPLVAGIVMAGGVMLSYSLLQAIIDYRLATLIAVFVGMVIYAVLILALKSLNKEDLDFLPGKRVLSKFVR